ncbi:MAG: hypothetical protein WCH43_04120, partial [Verrucomicrobiota bacterium]
HAAPGMNKAIKIISRVGKFAGIIAGLNIFTCNFDFNLWKNRFSILGDAFFRPSAFPCPCNTFHEVLQGRGGSRLAETDA